jgi:hypothetical protein
MENYVLEVEKAIPSIPCLNVTFTPEWEEKARLDALITDPLKRSGDYHCYCKQMWEDKSISYTLNYKFKKDN